MSHHRRPGRPSGRELHVVDVENLLGGPACSVDAVAALAHAFERVAAVRGEALIVVGASHGSGALASGLGWCGARVVWQPGHDGADRALLEVLTEDVANRFERVVIGSGDGAFAPMASHLRIQGCRVTVIARRGAVSRKIRMAVRDIRYIHGEAASGSDMRSAA